MTANSIDSILRLLNRELWIVTSAHGDRRGGLLATWVSSASIDSTRPVMLIGISPNHFTAELIETSGAFAVHLLDQNSVPLAWNFTVDSGRDRDKFAGLEVDRGTTASPLLRTALAYLECRVSARLMTGDRTYFWGDVLGQGQRGNSPPLCEQQFIQSLTDEQKKLLATGRNADVEWQRPRQDAWRSQLPELLWPSHRA